MNHLHIDSVSKSYDTKVILSDVYMSCKKGETVGLIGRNGSGKSTLLKIIFGIEKADFKFVRVGENIIKSVKYGRGLINYLPQDNFLPNNVSVKYLIHLFLEKAHREAVLENEYIQPLLKKQNQQLSGGEKRIVEILLMAHSNADFVLLDEPFNGLSPIMKTYVIEYINGLKSSKGFIITDHDYENVIQLADRIMYLQNGFLKSIQDLKELVTLGYMSEGVYEQVSSFQQS
ncbi:ATP-binding cassette domain-containing protein [Mangrovimonas xylaniphaga]|uniref:ATP-binding cassette domain-containing protein n=1 Tax=Mangrovimonas xylaniphaga TaxID=1645915 RepID=UPI0006B56F9D|nr:ATP-binding cassette domain-containing protein [Mangrovimonas xylaniphaga]